MISFVPKLYFTTRFSLKLQRFFSTKVDRIWRVRQSSINEADAQLDRVEHHNRRAEGRGRKRGVLLLHHGRQSQKGLEKLLCDVNCWVAKNLEFEI